MVTMIHPLEPPQAAAGSIDPILEIMNDADLTMGEKLLRMEALFVHDSSPETRLGRSAGRARRGAVNARVRGCA
jgi:hypothetical protein